IDSPSFATGFVRRIRDRSIPRCHYVAPSVWAWRPWRVHKFKRRFDCILALLPFEPKWFERVGLECRFVGHPVVEYGADRGDGPGFRQQHDIPADAKVICVLPGSRRGEVKRLGPVFAKTLARLAAKHPGLTAVVPSVPAVEGLVGHMIRDWPVPAVLVASEAAKYDAMAASDLGLAASGTVAVELALAGVPSVIAYRVALVTAALARLLLRVKFASLVNLILEAGAVPEFLQSKCRPDKLARELERLLGPDGAAQIEIVQPALDALGRGDTPPSQRAAEAVLDVIQRRADKAQSTSS
ncbi:MAG: lipid-A-disaccharide synthase, partial [Alphaproteobacteria bacterium]|nr:lipid-A-disaccharide synthase [Alphaproteobacteria bacterium]